MAKQANMGELKEAAEDVVAKVTGKLNQLEIDAVERRLSLNGGTLIVEVAADLTNRFGKSGAIIAEGQNIRAVAQEIPDDRKELRRKQNSIAQQKLTEGEELRKEEISRYSEKVLAYIQKEYGDERRDKMGNLSGYGDRVEVKQGHIRKLW